MEKFSNCEAVGKLRKKRVTKRLQTGNKTVTILEKKLQNVTISAQKLQNGYKFVTCL